MKKRKFDKVACISILIMVLFTIAMIIVGIKNNMNLINSDDASEMVYANFLAESHSLLTTDWYFSTELRILNTHLLRLPLFLISNNWLFVRLMGNVMAYALMIVSYKFCIDQLRIERKWFWYTSPLLLIPYSYQYFFVVCYGIHYVPYLVVTFLITGFYAYIYHEEKHRKLIMSFLFLLSFLSGLGGIRQLLVTFLPVLGTLFCLFLLYAEKIPWKWGLGEDGSLAFLKKVNYFFISVVLAFVGYILNIKVLSKIYTFDIYNSLTLKEVTFDNIEKVLKGFFAALGYDYSADNGAELFSTRGIAYLLALVFIFLFFVLIYWLLKYIKEMKIESQFLVLLFVVGLGINTFVYIFTECGFTERYYITAFIWIAPLLAVFYEETSLPKQIRQTFLVGFIGVLCLLGANQYYRNLKSDLNEDRMASYNFIVEQGYNHGYASFWQSNILTEFSNGEIATTTVILDENEDIIFHEWLQRKDNLIPEEPISHVFLLLRRGEVSQYEKHLGDKEAVFHDDWYWVYEFENSDEFLSLMKQE